MSVPAISGNSGNQAFIEDREQRKTAAGDAALKQHFQAEIDLVKSWDNNVGVAGAKAASGAPPPAPPSPPSGIVNQPPLTGVSTASKAVKPAGPTPTDDSQGHTIATIVPTDPNTYDKDIKDACEYYGKLYGVTIDPNVIKAHIWQESKGDPKALSQDGQLSRGLMQVSNSASVPTASIISNIKNPDGSTDPNIPSGGGNQYDPRTSIFTGVKYDALVMSGQMPDALAKSGLPPSELGDFSGIGPGISTADAMAIYQGGPGGFKTHSQASSTYSQQIERWRAMIANGEKLPGLA